MVQASRERTPLDAAFPLTKFPVTVSEEQRTEAMAALHRLGVTRETRNICYFGSFTSMVDMDTVVEAARQLDGRGDIRIVLCGGGDDFDRISRLAQAVDSLVLPGYVDAATMEALMEISVAGLAPYRARLDSLLAVSNKVIEYLSFGLPVIAGIGGALGELVDSHACGVRYRGGDADELARAISLVSGSDARRSELSRNARSLYQARYDPSMVYGRFADHVERVAQLGEQRAVGHASAQG